jgi:multicomponent K+:H+ antiporter subunit E
MTRWLPAPFLSLGLLVMWLLLARSLALGQVLLGLLLAVSLPLLLQSLRPPTGHVKRPMVLVRLVLRVGMDVVLSALQVAYGTLRSRNNPPLGKFVAVPLELRDEHALAALAVIASVIPGTVWSELATDRSVVLIHVFHVPDEAAFIHHFKLRYEQALLEIFE